MYTHVSETVFSCAVNDTVRIIMMDVCQKTRENVSPRENKSNKNDHRDYHRYHHRDHDRDHYRNKFQRNRNHEDRHDYHRENNEKEFYKRKYTALSSRHEHNYYNKYREHNERSRSKDRTEKYDRRSHDQYKYRKSSDEIRVKRESSLSENTCLDEMNAKYENKPKIQEKEKPNFELSGKSTVRNINGVMINYSEPEDAWVPKRKWRLDPFKPQEPSPTFYIYQQSAYLIGRDKIADIPLNHPSCCNQHAVLQYRLVPYKKKSGAKSRRVRLYIIDLESENGTYINNVKLEPRKYYELFKENMVQFGYSVRQYILLHENSKDDFLDDDIALTNKI